MPLACARFLSTGYRMLVPTTQSTKIERRRKRCVSAQFVGASRAPLVQYHDSHLQRPRINMQKSVRQKSCHGRSYEPSKKLLPCGSVRSYSILPHHNYHNHYHMPERTTSGQIRAPTRGRAVAGHEGRGLRHAAPLRAGTLGRSDGASAPKMRQKNFIRRLLGLLAPPRPVCGS